MQYQLQLQLQLQLYFIRLLVTIDWPAKIAIANLGGPVKRKIHWKEKKGKEKERKTTIWSYNK